MKMSKTILPALAMLLVSAVMLSTASFAWFALNTSVSVSDMEVNVKSDSVYLLIQNVEENTQIPAIDSLRATASTSALGSAIGDTTVFPSAYYTNSLKGDNTQFVEDGSDLSNPNNWYYATGANVANKDAATDESVNGINDRPLTSFDEYVVRYRYLVCLAEGSTDIGGLYIKDLSITDKSDKNVAPVKVVVACGDNYFEYDNKTASSSTNFLTGNVGSDGVLNGDEIIEFWIYVYYDGNHKDVFTNNIAELDGADISFLLTKEVPSSD